MEIIFRGLNINAPLLKLFHEDILSNCELF
jgi:hypothetical protein